MKKVALVTGSSQGIGAGIAKYLLQKGFFVYVTYNKNLELAKKAFGTKDNSKIVHLDLKNGDTIKDVVATITQDFGYLDLLVNNAAVESPGNTEKITLNNWHEVFEVGLFGKFSMVKEALPLLKKSRGVIVNIASDFAHHPDYKYQIYSAMEAGIVNYTKSSAVDFARYGIRVHAVNPGAVRTDMMHKILEEKDTDEFWSEYGKGNPLGRNCTPEDIAKTIYFLASEDAAFLNGNEVYVNGGSHLTD